MKDDECIFCKIIEGIIPSKKVYEDEHVVAFLDIQPFVKGHTVVVPKVHCYNFLDILDENVEPFFIALKKISIKLKEKLQAEGINIFSNNFPVAGQVIGHMHFHVLPRWKNDTFPKIIQPKKRATDEELQTLIDKLNS